MLCFRLLLLVGLSASGMSPLRTRSTGPCRHPEFCAVLVVRSPLVNADCVLEHLQRCALYLVPLPAWHTTRASPPRMSSLLVMNRSGGVIANVGAGADLAHVAFDHLGGARLLNPERRS
ncbi:hypothetical protein C8F04DRAFT_1142623 [Mycena alexandri]|uniref:Secreted protein n=1 Tax=Mycena alexandri TaxID=1745969 RepID=A0AAD6S5D1_9AGAR|nr:hypothetical protein C8F04DRAFT_1142623 [Mycena alexandri]